MYSDKSYQKNHFCTTQLSITHILLDIYSSILQERRSYFKFF